LTSAGMRGRMVAVGGVGEPDYGRRSERNPMSESSKESKPELRRDGFDLVRSLQREMQVPGVVQPNSKEFPRLVKRDGKQ